jgi:hypothetical protein
VSERTVWKRFWAKVNAFGPCWEWVAYCDPCGYGRFGNGPDGEVMAHRVAWLLLIGPIPEGMELDHLCRNRPCVNPDHLEVVTRLENVRRTPKPGAKFKSHCHRGHPMSGDNLYVSPTSGNRTCRECQRIFRESKQEAKARAMPTMSERLKSQTSVGEVTGCWVWQGKINAEGYARIPVGKGRVANAHEASYEVFVGPIPDGLRLNHLCNARACINPDHLKPVDPELGPTACKRGHPFDAENTYVIPTTGSRSCKECARQRNRDSKARKKSAA